jgi:hypothetical protein
MSDALFNVEPDDDAVPGGRMIPDGPWGIKWMGGRDRQMARDAAKRAKQTIGEWLGEAIRAYVESERIDADIYTVLPPGGQGLIESAQNVPPLSIEDIGRVLQYTEQIARLREQKPSPRLLAGVRRLLALRLDAAIHVP